MQNDLISRSALIEIFKDLSDIEWNQKAAPVSWADAYDSFVDALEDAPAVDAVEVVRCKDCKWALPNDASNEWVNCGNCFEIAQRKDWFCADGERRADE